MIGKIGIKNIARKKGRSAVVITAVAIGIWVGMFVNAFNWGMYQQRMQDVVDREISHIQIHPQYYMDDFDPKFQLDSITSIREKLQNSNLVNKYSVRKVLMGQLNSLRANAPVRMVGVNFQEEEKLTSFLKYRTEGEKFKIGAGAPHVLVGEKLAKKLKVKIGNKLNFNAISQNEQITFTVKVRGLYKTPAQSTDELIVYVDEKDIERKTQIKGFHEVAILLNNYDSLDVAEQKLSSVLPNEKVESWKKLVPELATGLEMYDKVMFVFMMIIWFALALGIINTMLMSVLERTRELGMLMAIGMSKWRIIKMVFFETLLLTSTGVPIGLFLTWASVSYFGNVGLDLSLFSSALQDFGYDTLVYPMMETRFYAQVIFQVILVAIVSTIFPAYRALKLSPVEAIRKL